MSNAVSEPPLAPGMAPVTMSWETLCIGSKCMAWEPTKTKTGLDLGEQGYCKLMENIQC